MQRGRGRGRRGGRGNPNWQGGGQDFQQGPPAGGMMGGPMMMGAGWGGPDTMMPGPGPMMGGPPGMMGGPGMMGPMDAGMQPQFGFNEAGAMPMPLPKRMRHMEGPMDGGQMQQQQQQQPQQPQQQQQPQNQQQPRGQGWAGMVAANDYCQNFVDTGLRPQNYLGENFVPDPLDGYPVQQELRQAKMEQVAQYHTPPYGIRADLRQLTLSQKTFGTRFDVVLIDPPWEEYVRRAPGFIKEQDKEVWGWTQIRDLDIAAVADDPSFVFLWCGCEEGLDAGRHCLEKWGFRRIEDICWIKTNRRRDEEADRKYLSAQHQDPRSTLVHTKEHCLVGLRGNRVFRSTHHAFVHANCDTDIICSEEPPLGSTEKPEELYNIIQRFCNGRRRLELFGEDHNIRPGWVTVGKNISHTNFKAQTYADHFRDKSGKVYTSHDGYPPAADAPVLVPSSDVIERNRPKSPPQR